MLILSDKKQNVYLMRYHIISNMIPRNLERRETIQELWLQGYTVDEISSQTGIPRSSLDTMLPNSTNQKTETIHNQNHQSNNLKDLVTQT